MSSPSRHLLSLPVLVALLTTTAGCVAAGSQPSSATTRLPDPRAHWKPGLSLPPPSGKQVAITSRAIEMVMLSVLPADPTRRARISFSGADRAQGALGVKLSYHHFPGAPAIKTDAEPGEGDYPDDDFVYVVLYPRKASICGSGVRCAALEPVDGSTVTLTWFTTGSEDGQGPGDVSVFATHPDGSVVMVSSTFDTITGDPRKQRLTLGIAEMRALVGSPRLGRTTDRALVRAGLGLPQWDAFD